MKLKIIFVASLRIAECVNVTKYPCAVDQIKLCGYDSTSMLN